MSKKLKWIVSHDDGRQLVIESKNTAHERVTASDAIDQAMEHWDEADINRVSAEEYPETLLIPKK